MRLSDFKVLTFDCYGTLIDWESGMLAALLPLTNAASARAGKPIARNAILEAHARNEVAAQRQTPAKLYRDLLAVVYKRLAEDWGVPANWEECQAYGRSVGDWPAFADSPAALAYLKQHFRLVILSNVDNENFAESNARLGVTFDCVFTAEDIGSYKPDPRNFTYMLEHLARPGLGGVAYGKGDILHIAESLFHDHAPANAAGLASCWIHRRHDQSGFGATLDPGARPRTDFVFKSMGELAAAHRTETAAA
jgi:2-haloacid dehalogenase